MGYDDVINNNIGVVTGTASAVNFPSRAIKMARFLADASNPASSFLGTTANHMWPMAAGNDTGWVLADDLADFWYRGTGTATPNLIHYWTQ